MLTLKCNTCLKSGKVASEYRLLADLAIDVTSKGASWNSFTSVCEVRNRVIESTTVICQLLHIYLCQNFRTDHAATTSVPLIKVNVPGQVSPANELKNCEIAIWFFVYIALRFLNCDWLLVTDEQNFLSTDQIALSVNSASFRPNGSSVSIRTQLIRRQSVKCTRTFSLVIHQWKSRIVA